MPSILDQYGKPAQYRSSGYSLYADTQTGGLRQSRPHYDTDHARLLSRAKFRSLLSDSRLIHAQFSVVSSAAYQKATFVSSSGWAPIFTGQDKAFGERLLSALRPALASSTNKGFSFDRTQQTASQYMDVDGGFFKLLATDSRGFPVTQIIEAHRIGCRSNSDVVATGRYKGRRIQNGIIYSADGAELAYQFLGATAAGDRIVPAQSMLHCAEWTWHSENRPWPAIAYGMLDFYDSKEARGYQKIKNKIHSSLAVIETTPTGASINANSVPGAAAQDPAFGSSGMRTELLEGGMFRYLKANAGTDLKPFEAATPAGEWQDFDQTIVSSALQAMRWSPYMLDLSKLKGAGYRGFASIINKTIKDRHRLVCAYAMPELLFKVATLQARGDIPEHPEWDQLAFPQPAEFDVDPGHTQKLEEANARIGRTSIPRLIRKDGHAEPDVILRENAEWLAQRNALAAQYGLDPNELGTLSKPGDAYTMDERGDSATSSEDDDQED